MTDKPQQGAGAPEETVSRETPEPTGTEQSGQDLLNEIMDRAMNKSSGPSEEKEKEQALSPDAPAPKNRPSSVYTYLAVLFGAAFLMLLLAYFVQQRNSTAVQDDLRIITASREELLEEIERLEKENDNLQKDVDLYKYATDVAREQYAKAREESDEYRELLNNTRAQLWAPFYLSWLELFINEGDYLMAATVVTNCDYLFNEYNNGALDAAILPIQISRYEELRDSLIKNGHITMMEYTTNQGTIMKWATNAALVDNPSDETREICSAAQNLWSVIYNYSDPRFDRDASNAAAYSLAYFLHPEYGNAEQLNGKNFKPSTIALFEQIKADLTERGFLMEQDGILYYVEDGEPVDIYIYFGVPGGENQASPEDEYVFEYE